MTTHSTNYLFKVLILRGGWAVGTGEGFFNSVETFHLKKNLWVSSQFFDQLNDSINFIIGYLLKFKLFNEGVSVLVFRKCIMQAIPRLQKKKNCNAISGELL